MKNSHYKQNRSGFTMVECLVAGAVFGILTVTVVKMQSFTWRSISSVYSDVERLDMSETVNSLFEDTATCELSGLVGYHFQNLGNPGLDPVVLHLPEELVSITANAKQVFSLRFKRLAGLEAVSGGTLYFATLTLDSSTSSGNHKADLYVKAVLDANNTIIRCFQRELSTEVLASCGSQIILGFDSTGNTLCGSNNLTPDYVSPWVAVPQTITHNMGTLNYRIFQEYKQCATCPVWTSVVRNQVGFSGNPISTVTVATLQVREKKLNTVSLAIAGSLFTSTGLSPISLPGLARVRLFRY